MRCNVGTNATRRWDGGTGTGDKRIGCGPRTERPGVSFPPLSQRLTVLVQLTMSCTLPPEILDLIVDHLHNQPAALRACCIVSSSWVPRTQKYLFARIEYHALNPPDTFERWKNTFPDPSNSPAHYVRTLSFYGLTAATATDAKTTGSWIRAFCRVVNLHVNIAGWEVTGRVSLAQLHGLSPNLKSIYLAHSSIPPSEVFNLICSFPLLEDLWFDLGFDIATGSSTGGWVIPSTSPKLTGSLRMMGNIRSTARQLCDLPDGLRFSKIMVWCPKEDVESIMQLVSRCSGTLESLSIYYYLSSAFSSASDWSGSHHCS